MKNNLNEVLRWPGLGLESDIYAGFEEAKSYLDERIRRRATTSEINEVEQYNDDDDDFDDLVYDVDPSTITFENILKFPRLEVIQRKQHVERDILPPPRQIIEQQNVDINRSNNDHQFAPGNSAPSSSYTRVDNYSNRGPTTSSIVSSTSTISRNMSAPSASIYNTAATYHTVNNSTAKCSNNTHVDDRSSNSAPSSSRNEEMTRLASELQEVGAAIQSALQGGRSTVQLKARRAEIEDKLEQLAAAVAGTELSTNDAAVSVPSSIWNNNTTTTSGTIQPFNRDNAFSTSLQDNRRGQHPPPAECNTAAQVYGNPGPSYMQAPTGDESNPRCDCGMPCLMLTSRQPTSLNREFFKCSRQDDKCNFFKWADDDGAVTYRDSNNSSVVGVSMATKDPGAEIQRMFGHKGFRPGQRECVDAALAGRDVFCLMPTGGGKSIVYQLPAWCCSGLAVVFSPLLSLIQDQVDAMNAISIRSVFFNSTQDEEESRSLRQELLRYNSDCEDINSIKLLYVTPEKLSRSASFRSLLASLNQKGMLSRFIIDEAHCMSQWGHDFRPDYLALSNLRKEYPNVPIMALTATANESVVTDSIRAMGMRDPYKHTQSFNRPNLQYKVLKKDGKCLSQIASIIRERKHQTGIIYCLSKKGCEELVDDLIKELPEMRNSITFYHADVRPEVKEKRQRAWSRGDVKVIVATIAFGMGINKPDVRYVIHHSLPKSLINYYQESGRAGRDGGIAECLIFFGYKDKGTLSHMISRGQGEDKTYSAASRENKQRGIDNLLKCVGFCLNTTDCRRVQLLEYFGEQFPKEKCNKTCDNCITCDSFQPLDVTSHALAIIKLVVEMDHKKLPRLTLLKLAKFYSGSKDKDLQKYMNLSNRPSKCTLSKEIVERIMQTMIVKYYLEEESIENASGFAADYVKVGQQARKLENGQDKLEISIKKSKSKSSSRHQLVDEMAIEDEEYGGDEIETTIIQPASNKLVKNKSTSKPPKALKMKPKSKIIDFIDDDSDDSDCGNNMLRAPISTTITTSSSSSMRETEYSNDPLGGGPSIPNFLLSSKQVDLLYRWLNEFRKVWDKYWIYIDNSALTHISKTVPVTIDQLAAIPGIGVMKAKKVGELTLATIYAFLEKHDLLHLFPLAQQPTMEPCPTWQDPLSSEAAEIRKSHADKASVTATAHHSHNQTQSTSVYNSATKPVQNPYTARMEQNSVPPADSMRQRPSSSTQDYSSKMPSSYTQFPGAMLTQGSPSPAVIGPTSFSSRVPVGSSMPSAPTQGFTHQVHSRAPPVKIPYVSSSSTAVAAPSEVRAMPGSGAKKHPLHPYNTNKSDDNWTSVKRQDTGKSKQLDITEFLYD